MATDITVKGNEDVTFLGKSAGKIFIEKGGTFKAPNMKFCLGIISDNNGKTPLVVSVRKQRTIR